MKNLVNEELNKMKYLLGYQRGMVISEQTLPAPAATGAQAPAATGAQAPAAASSTEDVIKKIQEILNTKYGAKLTVDGKWGNLTQTAFESAAKSKSSGTAAPAGTPKTVIPGTPDAPNPTAQKTVIPGTPDAPNPTVQKTVIPGTPDAPNPTTGTAAPAAPAAPATPAAAQTTADSEAQSPDDIAGVAPQSNRDQRRERQDMRRSQRRERQDLRAQQRGQ